MNSFQSIYGSLMYYRHVIHSLEETNQELTSLIKENSKNIVVFQKELDEIKRDTRILNSILKRLIKNLNKGRFRSYREEHKSFNIQCLSINRKFQKIHEQI